MVSSRLWVFVALSEDDVAGLPVVWWAAAFHRTLNTDAVYRRIAPLTPKLLLRGRPEVSALTR
ncbi:MAG: hypothetical protein NZ585_11630 [Chloracidobacterium sp.]|nr:hypothetical protein [Chloracidobacterium sp.]MDW8218280.1 hypothetical protein [Acidobacteriota bacterium]